MVYRLDAMQAQRCEADPAFEGFGRIERIGVNGGAEVCANNVSANTSRCNGCENSGFTA